MRTEFVSGKKFRLKLVVSFIRDIQKRIVQFKFVNLSVLRTLLSLIKLEVAHFEDLCFAECDKMQIDKNVFFFNLSASFKMCFFFPKHSRIYVGMCRSLKAAKSQLLRASWVFISDFHELFFIPFDRRGTQLAAATLHAGSIYATITLVVYVATIRHVRFKTSADLMYELYWSRKYAILIVTYCQNKCESSGCNRSREMTMLLDKNFCKMRVEQCNLTIHREIIRSQYFCHVLMKLRFEEVMLWKINVRKIYVLCALFHAGDNKYFTIWYICLKILSYVRIIFNNRSPMITELRDVLIDCSLESSALWQWLDNKN